MTSLTMQTSPTWSILDRWRNLTLAGQFVVMGGIVVVAGMLTIGFWVAHQIERGVTRNAGNATALYVDSFITPLTRELETSDSLSIGPISALDEIFKDGPVSERVMSIKIWKPDGLIVYSNDYDLIGKKFSPTDELKLAVAGEVVASFDSLDDEEDLKERQTGLPLVEIYSPIRAPWSGRVVAVAELYENGSELKKSITQARQQSWLIVAAIMIAMAALLMTIVYRGSKTIDEQNEMLNEQLHKVMLTSKQNHELHKRVQTASQRVTELNERFLNRTSAELHDGPAQLLGYASLRLDEAAKIENKEERFREISSIGEALDNAMLEIRNLCKGLSLPEIEQLSVNDIVYRVSSAHCERTDVQPNISLLDVDIGASKSVKICIYRFLQEALNNNWKHAPKSNVSIRCRYGDEPGLLKITVSDDGPGFDPASTNSDQVGLGIGGLSERIRSIGGEFHLQSSLGEGTQMTMQVELNQQENNL